MPIKKGLEWTFDTVAQQYERSHPEYVPELYEDLCQYKPVDRTSHVLEVGIGGGQATAVEYGKNFSELCWYKFREFPGFSVIKYIIGHVH